MHQQAISASPAAWSADWAGSWIWCSSSAAARNAYALFRRDFSVSCPAKAVIRITADSHYLLHVDGRFTHRGPARAPLRHYLFDELSVDLPRGHHCLAVLAHHVGEVNATMMLGRPGLLANVVLTPRPPLQVWRGGDAGCRDLSTGPEWVCLDPSAWRRDLPERMSHFGFWEELDLRRLPAGWVNADFADAGSWATIPPLHAWRGDGGEAAGSWASATVVAAAGEGPWRNLARRDIALLPLLAAPEPVPVGCGTWQEGQVDAKAAAIPAKVAAARRRTRDARQHRMPFRMPANAGGYVTVDFGRTVSGYVTFQMDDCTPGQVAEVSFDEMLAPDGAVNPARTYAHLTDRYVLPGGRCTVRGTHPRGFRYVTLDLQATDAPAVIRAIGAIEETYPFELRGSFAASDGTLERDYRKAAETVRIATADAFMDCPTRERVQWMEDLYMHSLTSLYAFGDVAMVRHALRQAAQCQLADGRINGFFPSERDNCAFASSSLMWLLLLAEYAFFTDAADDAREVLPAARRLLDLLHSLEDEDGLIARWPAGQFWDWAPIEANGCLLLTNAAYALALDSLQRHPDLRDGLPQDLPARAERLRRAAHRRFWLPSSQTYSDAVLADGTLSPVRSQHANSMAVLAGVCPAPQRVHLMRRIIARENLADVPVGERSLNDADRAAADKIVPVGTLWFGQWLCRALFECGLGAEAVDQMRALWGAYAGLPTFPEVRIQQGNTGFCHGWASGPAFLLPRYVLGLAPAAPGWREVRFSPRPGGLQHAEGSVITPMGRIRARWERREGGLWGRLESEKPVRLHVAGAPACAVTAWEGWLDGER